MQNTTNEANGATELLRELIRERRSERRWKNFRFFVVILLLATAGFLIFANNNPSTISSDSKGYVALVRLNGDIGPGEEFSAETVLPALKDAFSDRDAKGVVLDINSGGGTPVQASIIHDAILDLKKKTHKKVIVVGEDMMASGAYFVAVAADKIYVNPNTLTGSVGVIMKEFGFTDLIKKMGVERRVYASGTNKDRLDPFLPQNPNDLSKIRGVISEIHGNFIAVVKQGRQGKLQGETNDLFSGDFWSGQTALKLGLVDKLGNLSDVMHNEFQVAAYKDYSHEQSLVKSLMGQVGASLNLGLNSNRFKVVEQI
ncbi:MAG TPA: S49 family peptidase [Gammaproteobacteria bacterium]|nr:S49 family peptidase [Gammaproteobacteria bacterium]